MKNYEKAGLILGAVLGVIGTGICVYPTESVFLSLISLSCTILSWWIGKSINKKYEKNKKKITIRE